MADFILARKSRNIMSSITHIILNLLLGIGSVAITILSSSPILGLILVLVSKWRVFAVRPRYLMANLKANLVDIIVGGSVVLLTYYSGTTIMIIDIILAIFYCIWLLFIKPLDSERATIFQSLISVFLGMSAITIAASTYDSILVSAVAFFIGYASSRHILVQTDEEDFMLTTLTCGLIFAEIACLCHSWMIIYVFGQTGIRIPQLAIILTIFSFTYNYTRNAIIKYDKNFRFKDIIVPIIFSIILIGVIVLWFSKPIFNI